MEELYDEFIEKTDYLTETKGLLKDRINSLGGSITSGTTFRDYLVWLDSLYEALDEKTITGLPDSLEGNIQQTTTQTGKNYLPITLPATTTLNGITVSYDSSTGYITISGTASANTNIYWDFGNVKLPSTTYVQYENDFSTTQVQLLFYSNTSTYEGGLTFNGLNRIYNLSSSIGGKTINRVVLNVASGTTVSGKCRPMIHTQSTIQTYEPYIPNSPSPNYPQPIETRTGRQVVWTANNQLLPPNWHQGMISTSDGVTIYANSYWVYTPEFLDIHNYDDITISFKETCYAVVFFYNQNKERVGQGQFFRSENYHSFTPKTSNYYYMRIGYNLNATAEATNPITIYNHEPMVNKGTTALPYEKGDTYEINLGKNLMNLNSISTTYSYIGITFTKQADGSLLINGTSTSSNDVWIIISNISYNKLYGTPSINIGQVQQDIKSNEVGGFTLSASITNGTLKGFSYNANNDATACLIGAGASFDNAVLTVQLEKGNLSDYTPYKTPIELCKIGTYQDRIFKTSGKNLFDDSTLNNQWVGQDGSILTANGSNCIRYECSEGQTYSLTATYGEVAGTYEIIVMAFYNSNGALLSRQAVGFQTTLTLTMTAPTNSAYMYAGHYSKTPDTIQLEKGSASEYEPYGTGQWYIHKEIGRVVLNGSENWSYISVAQGILYRSDNAITNAKNDTTYSPLCNYFRGISLNQQGLRQDGDIYLNAGYNYTDVIDNTHTTSTIFKNFLASNNVEVYYVLKTSTNTLIEDEELINQLNEIEIFTVISEDFYN